MFTFTLPPPPPNNTILLIVMNEFGSFLLTPPSGDLTLPPFIGGKREVEVKWEWRMKGEIFRISTPLLTPPLVTSRKLLKKRAEENIGRGVDCD